jgi:hypothetical protein
MSLGLNRWLAGGSRPGRHSQKTDSGHIGTFSITFRVRRTSRNVMKPRIQCVLTPVEARFHCVRQRTDRHDQHKLTGTTVLVVLM